MEARNKALPNAGPFVFQEENMPAFDRIDRISEEVRREIDTILREDISDPRVCGTWSITRCEVCLLYTSDAADEL